MIISREQFSAAETALATVMPMTQPADAALARFFRNHRALGPNERGFVAETVFGILRKRYSLEFEMHAATSRQLLFAYLNRIQGLSLRQLEPLMSAAERNWAVAVREPIHNAPLHVAAELPEWLVELLAADMPHEEILTLGRALQQPGPLDLRVNSMNANRDDVLRQFHGEGLNAKGTPYSPFGVRLEGKPALQRHPLFLSGAIEVQDEGSQLVCQLLAPRRREMVVDFCAGAGGKTLMLGALMQSLGRLYAFDVSEKRLEKFKPRLKRSRLSNVHPQLLHTENDLKVKRLAGKIDRVLVDAPCTGFGTLRRNPDLKWRQTRAGLAELTAKQSAILKSAAQMVKPGGHLVYATCSFLGAENQDIITAFLQQHSGFSLLPANQVLAQQHVPLDTGEFLQLYPHRHGCDGFFAAVLRRSS